MRPDSDRAPQTLLPADPQLTQKGQAMQLPTNHSNIDTIEGKRIACSSNIRFAFLFIRRR